jgi:hypothetical protein
MIIKVGRLNSPRLAMAVLGNCAPVPRDLGFIENLL